MPVRFVVSIIIAFFLTSDLPALVVENLSCGISVGTVQAKSVKSKKKRRKRKKKKRRRRRRKKRRKVKPPRPILKDDPSIPLSRAWKNHLDSFFKQSRPIYGAFVAIRPKTGEVITLSEFSRNKRKIPHPATTAAFPAASTFKIVTAAALMEEKKANPNTVTCYRGGRSRLTTYHLSKP
ncbi:MAG: hypothetical protein GXP54_00155, partial [Deltaproteobacteria bacterium]|nr:hypothetical protein [Deltaproteobacteria bacterium]